MKAIFLQFLSTIEEVKTQLQFHIEASQVDD